MHRRLHAQLAPLILLPLLAGGCVQMTRHSNMMIFGTNTVVGVRAGVNATSVPEVAIGYTRQEAVVMPLVANVTESTKDSTRLVPCNPGQEVTVKTVPTPSGGTAVPPKFLVHPCLLVAVNGKAQDSYSVLASFGANFGGSADATHASAQAGLSQYFATGVAAQMLALNGGAAVVATGDAAKSSAANPASEGTVRALFGNEAAYDEGASVAEQEAPFNTKLTGLITATATDQEVASKIATFEGNAGISTTMRNKCLTKAGCLAAIANGDYAQTYLFNQAKMDAALAKW